MRALALFTSGRRWQQISAMLRFAPSPNGPLHLGHALSAIANETMADALGAPLSLRMEDIDTTRCRPAFEAAIVNDLAALGIAWRAPLVRQSDRFDRYRAALATLAARGLVYPSFASRREIAGAARRMNLPRDPDGAPRFTGDTMVLDPAVAAARRKADEPAAFRLDMARALAAVPHTAWCEVDALGANPAVHTVDPMVWGDVVLARKETPTSYHLSVVVDDAEQAITHVVRGRDLYAATAVHQLLQRLLDLPAPAYHHHPLILGADGRKLSKSNGAQSLAALRAAGHDGPSLRRLAALHAEHRQPEREGDHGDGARERDGVRR